MIVSTIRIAAGAKKKEEILAILFSVKGPIESDPQCTRSPETRSTLPMKRCGKMKRTFINTCVPLITATCLLRWISRVSLLKSSSLRF